jgi:adenylate cyclase
MPNALDESAPPRMTAPQRRLAAIMFSDIVGFSKLMGEDQQATVALVEEHNGILVPIIERHRGAVLKFIGDAVLASFDSAGDAVHAAVEIQRALAKRAAEQPHAKPMTLRIGIHVGDVVQKDNDVFGDGVNIAARVQPQAEPGGICLTQTVFDMVRAQPELKLKPIGARSLKNIEGKVKLYKVDLGLPKPKVPGRASHGAGPGRLAAAALLLAATAAALGAHAVLERRRADWNAEFVDAEPQPGPQRFTLLLMPFSGTDPDAANEGRVMQKLVAKTIEDALADSNDVKIITAPPKQHVHTRDEARDAGAKAGATVVIWGDVLNLRGQVEIQPYLTAVSSRRDESMVALDANISDADQMRLRKEKAAEVGNLGLQAASRYYAGKDPEKALELLRRISPPSADSELTQGYLFYNRGKYDEAEAIFKRTLQEFPDFAMAYNALGNVERVRGRYDEALKLYAKAIAIKPLHPAAHYNVSLIYAIRGDLDKAAFELRNVIGRAPDYAPAHTLLGEIYERQGHLPEASEQYRDALVKSQSWNFSIVNELLSYLAVYRSGQEDPARKELRAYLDGRGAAIPMHAWPLPVARFLAGDLGEDKLVAELDARHATPRMRCAAFYYLGMDHILRADKAQGAQRAEQLIQARARFQQVLATNVRYFFEYRQAKDWLDAHPG